MSVIMNKWLFVFGVLANIISSSYWAVAYPDGAPSSTCDSMTPSHDEYASQTTTPPYSISVSETTVQAGENITVCLQAEPDCYFRGVLLKAIPADSDTTNGVVGTFTLDDDDNLYQYMNCSDILQSAITHTTSDNKTNLTVFWNAPSYNGNFKFIATVVLEFSTFWTTFRSPDQVTVTGGTTDIPTSPTDIPTSPIPTSPTSTPSPFIYDYADCGVTRSCMGDTGECVSNQDCSILLTYRRGDDGHSVLFEMIASTNGYVAVGFSIDTDMGDDSVLECLVLSTGEPAIYASTNDGHHNSKADGDSSDYFQQQSISFTDGVLHCIFTRPYNTTVNGLNTDLFNVDYYILLVIGPLNDDGTDISKHSNLAVSSDRINISSDKYVVVNGEVGSIAIEVMMHGILMVIAWIGTSSLAVFLARYYKDMWPDTMHCKVKVWFAWHRGLNCATVIIAIASFILIVVYCQVKDSDMHMMRSTHAIMGTITIGLSILQPIGALFRPNPGTKNRPSFNYLHFLGGIATCICAISTIFLAVGLEEAYLPKYVYWILCGFIAFLAICYILMDYLVKIYWPQKKLEKESDKRTIINNDNDNDTPASNEVKKSTRPEGARIKEVLLVLFCCGVTAFTVALIVIIAT